MSDRTTQRPNILWICTDQQRWDTLGCYGNPWVNTPHLDRLADQGVLFEHCYSQSPVCTPSRASFLTGRYPRTNRCRQNGQSLPSDEVVVTRLLANAGYAGGLSGKLHIAACHPSVSPVHEPRIDDGYATFHWSHHPQPDWPTNAYFHWLRARGVSYEPTAFRGSPYVRAGFPVEHHPTTWCAQQAINFVENAGKLDLPWFFSINFFDPHHPFDPPVALLERYLDRLADIPLPSYVDGELQNKPVFQQIDHHAAYNTPGNYPFVAMASEDHQLIRAAYWAMVDLIDLQVGRLLDTLERTGQREHTLVVFMSDHGEMLGDHGIYLKGPYFYEPAVRVPLIVSWPRVLPAGRRSGALIELADLAPTLLEAAGLPASPSMQGRSLWPLLRDTVPRDHHRQDIYCEYLNAMPWHRDPAPYATMLRTPSHKLVVMHGLDTGELYDLSADPQETHNRWDDPDYRELRNTLTARLCDRIALTADPLPARVSPW